ncbi:hypothetical protein FACS1894132_08840 [Clostridia bacterium]|nr:hypothetical protein FACS1894132_08840 [Clostridia bacterium]
MIKIDAFISKRPILFLFTASFLIMFLVCLPDIIINHGYFYFYGDYNGQEIPFYIHVHDAIRNGNTAWDWVTGLGSDFISTYTYYCLTSPFFWLTIPFPNEAVPFFLPYLLSLKIALSSVFAFLYIKRFVKSAHASVIASFLYAFSGFQINNIFYPDFNEVFTFFPLLLIALEELIQNNKKGYFALIVCFSAVLNYYFFIGEVLFCVIYFLVRCNIWALFKNFLRKLSKLSSKGKCLFNLGLQYVTPDNKDFPVTWKKFFCVISEGIIGVLLAGFVLLPTYHHLAESTRLDEHIYGEKWLFYSQENSFLEVIRTMFMMPNMPASPLLFDGDQKWDSIAVFLPLFGLLGVISFMKIRKSHWASKLTIISLVFALVPILNSAFYLFNGNSHYGRWFYMPILVLCLMTAYSVQDLREEYISIGVTDVKQSEDTIMVGVFPEPVKESYLFGFRLTAIMLLIFAVIACIPLQKDVPVKNDLLGKLQSSVSSTKEVIWGDFAAEKIDFWLCLLFVVVIYIVLYILIIGKKHTGRKLLSLTLVACIATTSICFYRVYIGFYGENIHSSVRNEISLPTDEGYYRTDTNHRFQNYHLLWGNSGINVFHSTENPTMAEFYNYYHMEDSIQHFSPEMKFYAVRGLLSVKYYLENLKEKNNNKDFSSVELIMPGYINIGKQAEFDVYENTNYVPIGFAYDYYITPEIVEKYFKEYENATVPSGYKNAKELNSVTTVNALMNGLMLTADQVEKYSDIISEMPMKYYTNDKNVYVKACDERRSMSCESFEYDTNGFTATINLDKSRLVFFSIPYSNGWKATVNGKPAEVEKVDAGLMAVKVPQGETIIRFHYTTPGLEDGILVSFGGLILFLIFMFPTFKKKISGISRMHFHSRQTR